MTRKSQECTRLSPEIAAMGGQSYAPDNEWTCCLDGRDVLRERAVSIRSGGYDVNR